jgi:hypothetical protein
VTLIINKLICISDGSTEGAEFDPVRTKGGVEGASLGEGVGGDIPSVTFFDGDDADPIASVLLLKLFFNILSHSP